MNRTRLHNNLSGGLSASALSYPFSGSNTDSLLLAALPLAHKRGGETAVFSIDCPWPRKIVHWKHSHSGAPHPHSSAFHSVSWNSSHPSRAKASNLLTNTEHSNSPFQFQTR
jgi:hypothetical protein